MEKSGYPVAAPDETAQYTVPLNALEYQLAVGIVLPVHVAPSGDVADEPPSIATN